MEKRTYTVEDIADILNVSRSAVYLLIKRKAFRALEIWNEYRIPCDSFEAWLTTEDERSDT